MATTTSSVDDELNDLTNLDNDWDGDQSPKPSMSAVASAREAMKAVRAVGLVPTCARPMAGAGGAGIVVRKMKGDAARSVFIGCTNSGLVEMVLSDWQAHVVRGAKVGAALTSDMIDAAQTFLSATQP